MKNAILFLTILFLTVSLRAETAPEKRWRLRAEILERQLELAQMELREKNGTPAATSTTKNFVNAYGTRFAAAESNATQFAYLESNEVKPKDPPGDQSKENKKEAAKPTSEVQDLPPSDPAAWPKYKQFVFGYQILKPSTRVYFDVGTDDPGELDLFKDGNIGVSVDFLTLSWDYGLTEDLSVGVFAAGGISSTTSESDHSAIFIWSCGLAVNLRDLPFAFEAGVLQGVSASEMLSDHTDTAFFVGISLTQPVGKKHVIKIGNSEKSKKP